MATMVLSKSDAGEFGVEYNPGNGNVTAIYSTGAAGFFAAFVLDDGTRVPETGYFDVSNGQQLPVPAARIRIIDGPEGPEWSGVRSYFFIRKL